MRGTVVGPGDVYIPFISVSQPEQAYIIKGLGVFHHDRMVGELSGQRNEDVRFFDRKSQERLSFSLH